MNIKEIRAIAGLNQREFAEKYQIPHSTIKKWESSPDNSNYHEPPKYLLALLERVVREDYEK